MRAGREAGSVNISVRVDPAANSALYVVGEALILDVRWIDNHQIIQTIDDTAEFTATIFTAGGVTIASVSHELVGGTIEPTARFAFPLSIAGSLAGARGVYVSLARVLDGTASTFFTFNLPVRQLAGTLAPTGAGAPSVADSTLIEISPKGIAISPRGPAGASAAQQLAATRNEETGLPYIPAPTVAALAAWVRGPADEAAALANAAAAAATGANRQLYGVDLTNPQIVGLSALRVDGLDPDGSNAARANATLAYCAAHDLPVIVPAGALVGLGAKMILPDGLTLTGGPDHEFRRVFSEEGSRLIDTASVDVASKVQIRNLAWRGMPNMDGSYFRGLFRDSVLERLQHLGSDRKGLAISLGLYNTKVIDPYVGGMPDLTGCAGIRIFEGSDSVVVRPDVTSGDDALQFVAGAETVNKPMRRCYYDGGRGISTHARGGIASADVSVDTQVRDCGFINGVYLKGGGWPLKIIARSYYSWGVLGSRNGGDGAFAFSALSIRGNRPMAAGEQVVLTSALDPSWNATGPILTTGGVGRTGNFAFDSATKTITALAGGVPFSAFAVGAYLIVFDGTGLSGPNDGFISKIVARTNTVLTLADAPVDEVSALYTVSDNANFTMAAAGATGAAPADLQVKRLNPGMIDGLIVDAVCDDAEGIRPQAVQVSGYVKGLRARISVRNPRGKSLRVVGGMPINADNRIALRTSTAPGTADPVVDVPYSVGLALDVDIVAAPGQPGVSVRKTLEYDEDFPEVLIDEHVSEGVTVTGTVRGLTAGCAALSAGPDVVRIDATGLRPIGASGVTSARAVDYAAGATGAVSGCDFSGISDGNTLDTVLTIDPAADVVIGIDNAGLPVGTDTWPGSRAAAAPFLLPSRKIPLSMRQRFDALPISIYDGYGADVAVDDREVLRQALAFQAAEAGGGRTRMISLHDADLDIGDGDLGAIFSSNCGIIGGGDGTKMLVSEEGATPGRVLDLNGITNFRVEKVQLNFRTTLTLAHPAMRWNGGSGHKLLGSRITGYYGLVEIGAISPHTQWVISDVNGANHRATFGGDVLDIRQTAGFNINRLICNGTGFAPLTVPDGVDPATWRGPSAYIRLSSKGIIDTGTIVGCTFQTFDQVNNIGGGAYGLLFDCTDGDVYNPTVVSSVFDHALLAGVKWTSRALKADGVTPSTNSIRNHKLVGVRASVDGGHSRHVDFQGGGRFEAVSDVAGQLQYRTGQAIRVEAAPNASDFQAPEFVGPVIRSITKSTDAPVPYAIVTGAPLKITGGTHDRTADASAFTSKFAQVTANAPVAIVGMTVKNIANPVIDHFGGVRHPDTVIAACQGLAEDTVVESASPYRPETARWLKTATGTPARARKNLYDDLIQALVDAGLWNDIEFLALLAAGDEGLALHGMKVATRVLTKFGAIPFVADRGYTSNGTTGYIDTGYIPGSGGVATRDSLTLLYSTMTNVAADNAFDVAAGNNLRVNTRTVAGNLAARVNSVTSASIAVPDSIGTFALARTGANTVGYYADGAAIGATADASSALDGTTRLSIAKLGVNYSPRQIGAVMVAAGWDATKVAAATAAIRGYLIAVGAPV